MSISISRSKKAYPKESLYDGSKTAARASILGAGFASGVGSCVIQQGGVIIEKYGTAMPLVDGLFFHVRAVNDPASQGWRLTGYISVGPICNGDAPLSAGDPIPAWLAARSFFTLNVKKRNNGSFGSYKIEPVRTGNYAMVFDAAMDEEQYLQMWDNPRTLWGVLFSEVEIITNAIRSLRDCNVYISPVEDDNLAVSWVGAYNPEAHEETLWVLDNAGNQVAELRIYEDEKDGSRTIPLKGGMVYKLVVPGYSHRNYEVACNSTTTWVMEPAKLQFMGSLSAEPRFYFKILPGEQATFCMKDYTRGPIDGLYGATMTRIDDDFVLDFSCTPKTWYYEYDSWAMPVSDVTQSWRVDFKGRGRAGFWLDGIPNLFSDRLSAYKRPVLENNTVMAAVPSMVPANSIGFVPLMGHYMPYTVIPEYVRPTLADYRAEVACIYSIVDAIAKNAAFEDIFRRYMSETMGLKRDYTIQARNGRDAYLDYNLHQDVQLGTDYWVKCMARINDGREHFIAPADEPNYNYPTFESYRTAFFNWATFIKTHPDYAASGARIMAAASSRFDHGPNADASATRKGYLWAKQIIDLYPDLVDGVVWHEWTVRGLLNLRQYTKTVELAYTLSDNGRRRLALEQTNTAGGSSVSLYDQNTHFCSMWWAAVFIAVTRTGKLDDLMFFPIIDEIDHPKGLLFTSEYGADAPAYTHKPVGLFFMWLAQHLHGCSESHVYPIEQARLEVDLVCFSNTKNGVVRQFIMGVNKSARSYAVTLDKFTWAAPYKLEFWNPNSTASEATPTYDAANQRLLFDLPAETIFILSKGY